jgi:Tol biopolymer transport system component
VVQRLNGAGYVLIPEPLGLPASWSPTANELLVSQIHIDTHDEVIIYRLLRVDAGSGRVSPVASADAADGVYATWSPDGRLVAYGRETSTAQTVVGRQLWVMDSAGGAPRALTGESGVQHGAPHWSPDGRYLLFSRYRLGEPGRLEGLQLLEVETGAQRPISTEGLWPAWLP